MGFSSATHNVADETKPVMFTEPSLPVFAVSICLLRNTIGDCCFFLTKYQLVLEVTHHNVLDPAERGRCDDGDDAVHCHQVPRLRPGQDVPHPQRGGRLQHRLRPRLFQGYSAMVEVRYSEVNNQS